MQTIKPGYIRRSTSGHLMRHATGGHLRLFSNLSIRHYSTPHCRETVSIDWPTGSSENAAAAATALASSSYPTQSSYPPTHLNDYESIRADISNYELRVHLQSTAGVIELYDASGGDIGQVIVSGLILRCSCSFYYATCGGILVSVGTSNSAVSGHPHSLSGTTVYTQTLPSVNTYTEITIPDFSTHKFIWYSFKILPPIELSGPYVNGLGYINVQGNDCFYLTNNLTLTRS